ncbi:MAG: hypothetical protein MHMPM18_001765 [Marteilia pararefringens]
MKYIIDKMLIDEYLSHIISILNDNVLIGREVAYARLLPPANEDGLDDYSFFLPLITKDARQLYMPLLFCADESEELHTILSVYDGAAFDRVCTCKPEFYMNQQGKCVEECDNPRPSGRLGDDSKYCWD